jgi:hypothetical protein
MKTSALRTFGGCAARIRKSGNRRAVGTAAKYPLYTSVALGQAVWIFDSMNRKECTRRISIRIVKDIGSVATEKCVSMHVQYLINRQVSN